MKKSILALIIILLITGCTPNKLKDEEKLPYSKLIKNYKSNIPLSFKTDNPLTYYDRGNAKLKGLYKVPAKKRKAYIDNIVSEFNTAIQLEPHFAPAYYSLGLTYLKANEPKKAFTPFETAVLLNPEYKDYKLAYAYICAENGKTDWAIETYESLLGTDKKDIDILIPLGDLYISKKDYDKASETFKAVLKQDSRNLIASKALKKLKGKVSQKKKTKKDASEEKTEKSEMIEEISKVQEES